jgi:hypothetical protein
MEVIVSFSDIKIRYGGEHENCLLVDVTLCSLVEVWRRFVGFCCFLHRRVMFATSCSVDLIK